MPLMLVGSAVFAVQGDGLAMGSSLSGRIKTAVVKNDADGLRMLLQLPFVRGTDAVNLPLNHRQDAALALATRLGRYDLISVLLDTGAKVNLHHSVRSVSASLFRNS